ncbi:growth arrest-specific protein 2 [Lates japonicus]|uniref:Growth arrest-specific protein 2 n=1 Tax=Lates japonicus TaxID=270547 RepID=A0AAD3NNF1_LATJO|nr:growth arrest-specific protein 2 [Lates japonicus]
MTISSAEYKHRPGPSQSSGYNQWLPYRHSASLLPAKDLAFWLNTMMVFCVGGELHTVQPIMRFCNRHYYFSVHFLPGHVTPRRQMREKVMCRLIPRNNSPAGRLAAARLIGDRRMRSLR